MSDLEFILSHFIRQLPLSFMLFAGVIAFLDGKDRLLCARRSRNYFAYFFVIWLILVLVTNGFGPLSETTGAAFALFVISGILFWLASFPLAMFINAMSNAGSKGNRASSLMNGNDQSGDLVGQKDRGFSGALEDPIEDGSPETESHYETAWKELDGGNKNLVLWAKAFSLAQGDESKAKALYIKHRVNQLCGDSDEV